MIYDRLLTVYDLDRASSSLARRLIEPRQYLYGEMEVYYRRFSAMMQAGARVDRMARLWRADIRAGQYAVPEDGHVYRIVQAQHGLDEDGLPITTLSLEREEAQYDLFGSSDDA